jgi:hypothetical protein
MSSSFGPNSFWFAPKPAPAQTGELPLALIGGAFWLALISHKIMQKHN